MPEEARMLTHQQATAFYDHLGARQDWQAFYEAPATGDLFAHAPFLTCYLRLIQRNCSSKLIGSSRRRDACARVITCFGILSEVAVASKHPAQDAGS